MAVERNAAHVDTLTQLRLWFEERCKAKAVSSCAGLSQKELCAVGLEGTLEANELNDEPTFDLASKISTLRAEVCQFKTSADALGRERKEIVMFSQDVRESASHCKKLRSDAKMMGMRYTELARRSWEKDLHTIEKFARLKAVTEETASVMLELTPSCLESTNSFSSAHSTTNCMSKVEDGVRNALMAVLGEIAIATQRKVSIIGFKLKDALKQCVD